MAHGTSATFRMVAIEYARVFARAGLAALIYDHRNFGISDGAPRFEINPWTPESAPQLALLEKDLRTMLEPQPPALQVSLPLEQGHIL